MTQLALDWNRDAQEDRATATYMRGLPDRTGLAEYTHLIRHPGDGQRESRAARQKRMGVIEAARSWKTLDAGDVSGWVSAIAALMEDGEPRTFNRIVLELSAFEHTADTAFGKDPDDALWRLVEDGVLWWSCEPDQEATFFLHTNFITEDAP